MFSLHKVVCLRLIHLLLVLSTCVMYACSGHRVVVKGVGGFSCTHYNLPTHSVVQRTGSRDLAGVSGGLPGAREGEGGRY